MPGFTQLLFDTQFVVGATRYLEHYPGHADPRIVVTVSMGGRHTFPAVVDTAAPWCVLDPEIADVLHDLILDEDATTRLVVIRGMEYPGKLIRVLLGVQVDEGESREVEATMFVPQLPPGESWSLPNFLGLSGFLERVRFAVDPVDTMFYVGSL
jgi:hypothetical protein